MAQPRELSGAKDGERSESGRASEARTLCTCLRPNSHTVRQAGGRTTDHTVSGEATAWRSHELSGAKDSERSERGQASEARTLCTFVWNSYTVHDNEWKRLSFAHPARCKRSPLQAPGVWGWNPHNRHLSG